MFACVALMFLESPSMRTRPLHLAKALAVFARMIHAKGTPAVGNKQSHAKL